MLCKQSSEVNRESGRFSSDQLTRQAGSVTQRLLVSPECTRAEPVGLLNGRSAGWRRNENESRNSCIEAPQAVGDSGGATAGHWCSDRTQESDLITIHKICLNFYNIYFIVCQFAALRKPFEQREWLATPSPGG